MAINSVNSTDYTSFYSALFGNGSGSSNSNNTNSVGFGASLTDYASIRNGSYAKLLKAHYAKQEKEAAGATSEEKELTNKAYNSVKSASQDVKSALSALDSSSLYQKGSYQATSSTGEKKDSEYNYDAIYEKLNSFVEGYNSLIKAGSAEKASSANHLTLNMVSSTSRNAGMLDRIGISTDIDGNLSINRDKLNNADINTVKSLFHGLGSYADSISSRASMLDSISTNKLGDAALYTSKGKTSNTAAENSYTSAV